MVSCLTLRPIEAAEQLWPRNGFAEVYEISCYPCCTRCHYGFLCICYLQRSKLAALWGCDGHTVPFPATM
jgi:hypothetical protein